MFMQKSNGGRKILEIFMLFFVVGFLILAAGAAPADIFQNVTVEPVKDTSAVLKWEVSGTVTIETFTTSQISYGLDTNYGLITEKDDLSYFHRQEINGLTPGTTYHFRIKAIDYDGQEYVSGDYSFAARTQAEMDELVKKTRSKKDLPKTYYVSPDGNGSDGLSINNAFKTISQGMSVLEAGDTLREQAGTYNEMAQGLVNSGIPTHPISIVSDGNAVLDGQNNLLNGFQIDARDDRFRFWKIEGFTIQNYTGGGIGILNNGTNPKGWVVRNNIITDFHYDHYGS